MLRYERKCDVGKLRNVSRSVKVLGSTMLSIWKLQSCFYRGKQLLGRYMLPMTQLYRTKDVYSEIYK